MHKILALALTCMMLTGCVKNNQKIIVDVPSLIDYTPLLAWNLQTGPHPTPAPEPVVITVGQQCPTCVGTGIVGDGVTKKPCRDCKGDGRVDKGDPILGVSFVPETSILKYTYFIEYNGTSYIWDGVEFVSEGKLPISYSGKPTDIERMGKVQICQANKPCLLIQIQRR
jgi:hypothetical protein